MGANKVYVLSLDETPKEDLEGGGYVQRIVTKEKTGIDLTFSKGFAKPGCGHGKHKHEQDEVMFCLQGAGTMEIEGQGDVPYTAGTAFVIPAGVHHCNKNTSDDELYVVSMFNPALR